ncbi:hypothetical protein VNO77_03246 [Canavalia gladiata]|uniref:Uncharacterized protein n=1 Tax=Canavalia gladiata TaxID=3824 RepID=A0AAN9MUI3_CANGL
MVKSKGRKRKKKRKNDFFWREKRKRENRFWDFSSLLSLSSCQQRKRSLILGEDLEDLALVCFASRDLAKCGYILYSFMLDLWCHGYFLCCLCVPYACGNVIDTANLERNLELQYA